MNTSKAIKAGQHNPIEGQRNGNRWTFSSESRDRVSYTVERSGAAYKCGCPATGLCKHITSAVMDDAKAKYQVVQVWTSREDAKRQKRRTVQLTANGKPFWVTFAAISQTDRYIAQTRKAITEAERARDEGNPKDYQLWAEVDRQKFFLNELLSKREREVSHAQIAD